MKMLHIQKRCILKLILILLILTTITIVMVPEMGRKIAKSHFRPKVNERASGSSLDSPNANHAASQAAIQAASQDANQAASQDANQAAGQDANQAASQDTNQAAMQVANQAASQAESTDSISLFVRMGGKVAELRRRFYCVFFRSSVLFWPASYGKTVVVLDEESDEDNTFANILSRHVKEHFPDRKLEVVYEPLPKDPSVLSFPGSPKSPGYNRQLWSSFFTDLYTNDSVIAWMDTDAAFGSPVTKSSIFSGKKVRVLGYDCTMHINWVKSWARTTELALGLPFVADFMTYFPVYIYRDTFTHCREYILKRFRTSNFEKAFKKFYHGRKSGLSPVSVILSYAWYFERDRYDWNLKICTDRLTKYNKRFPSGHTIGPEHIENTLSVPQTAFHTPKLEKIATFIRNSYCLSHEAARNASAKCSNRTVSLNNNLVLFNHDIQRFDFPAPPCPGDQKVTCLQILEQYYNQVGVEIKQNVRKLEWRDLETVEKLANEVQLECTPVK